MGVAGAKPKQVGDVSDGEEPPRNIVYELTCIESLKMRKDICGGSGKRHLHRKYLVRIN